MCVGHGVQRQRPVVCGACVLATIPLPRSYPPVCQMTTPSHAMHLIALREDIHSIDARILTDLPEPSHTHRNSLKSPYYLSAIVFRQHPYLVPGSGPRDTTLSKVLQSKKKLTIGQAMDPAIDIRTMCDVRSPQLWAAPPPRTWHRYPRPQHNPNKSLICVFVWFAGVPG